MDYCLKCGKQTKEDYCEACEEERSGEDCELCYEDNCPHECHSGKASEYENEILDLIDHRDEFTRSDLQGAVQALVMKIMAGK